MSNPDDGGVRGLALVGTAVAEMVVPTLIGAWIDDRYSCQPWGVLLGAALGVIVSILHLVSRNRRPTGRN